MLRVVAPVLLITVLAFASACGGDSAGDDPTPTSETIALATPTERPTGPTPTRAPSIRDTDLSLQPAVMEFQETAGDVELTRIRFIDLTFDGAEEAIVVFSSGGTGGEIAAFVYGYRSQGIEELLRVIPDSGQVTVETLSGNLLAIEPLYAEGDPLCCPSENRTTVYRWEGDAFAVIDEIVAPAR